MRQPKPSEPKHLTASQAAALLQVSPKTVSRWAKEGKLPFVRTLGGHRRCCERSPGRSSAHFPSLRPSLSALRSPRAPLRPPAVRSRSREWKENNEDVE